jgi:hypothetical protein
MNYYYFICHYLALCQIPNMQGLFPQMRRLLANSNNAITVWLISRIYRVNWFTTKNDTASLTFGNHTIDHVRIDQSMILRAYNSSAFVYPICKPIQIVTSFRPISDHSCYHITILPIYIETTYPITIEQIQSLSTISAPSHFVTIIV